MMAKAKAAQFDKGGAAEEALRHYFRNLGAFVLRGVPIRQGRDDITDIDLWTYTRAGVHARHIAIVDIKNKKRAKGYERVIWLTGLKAAVKANEAVIASTSGRDDLKPFADRLGIRFLSQQVYSAVLTRYAGENDRLSSEELDQLWRGIKIQGAETLYSRMSANLEEVGLGVTFSALNTWIDEASALLTYAVDHEREPGPVTIAALLCCALVAVGGDYLGRELAFSDNETRREHFRQGLIFGSPDKNVARNYLGFAEKLVTDFLDRTGAGAATIRMGFNRAVERVPVAQFIEFFARPTAGRELMDAALQLESAAFAKARPSIGALPSEAKTIVGLVADYSGLDRRKVLGPTQNGEKPSEPARPTTEGIGRPSSQPAGSPNRPGGRSEKLTRDDGRLI
jgi:hypothetical protein